MSTTNKQEHVLKQQIVEIIEHERTRTSVYFHPCSYIDKTLFVLTKLELAKNPQTIKTSISRQLVVKINNLFSLLCLRYYVFVVFVIMSFSDRNFR